MADNKGQAILDRALLARLEKPEDLKRVLAREESQYDCLSCRVMGIYEPVFTLPHLVSR